MSISVTIQASPCDAEDAATFCDMAMTAVPEKEAGTGLDPDTDLS